MIRKMKGQCMGNAEYVENILAELRSLLNDEPKYEIEAFVEKSQDVFNPVTINDSDVNSILLLMKRHTWLPYYRDLGTKRPVRTFVKRAIRKAGSFLGIPLSKQQSEFNMDIISVFEKLLATQMNLQSEVTTLRAQIEDLQRIIQNSRP